MEVFMSDLSKITGKFDLQKIIGDVKSMVSPIAIPEADKSNPIAYCLSEISKLTKELADNHSKQADTISKISSMLGTLHQEVAKCPGSAEKKTQPPAEEPKEKVADEEKK
jgi:hypothetical protein